MDKVLELIKTRKDELLDKELPNFEEAKYLKTFLTYYNGNNIDTYDEITNIAYLGAVLLANHIDMDYPEFVKNLEKLENIINNRDLNHAALEDYLGVLTKLNNLRLLEDRSPNSQKLDEKTKKIYTQYKLQELDKKVFTLEEEKYYDSAASRAMIKLFKALPESSKFLSFIEINVISEALQANKNFLVNSIGHSVSKKQTEQIARIAKEKLKRDLDDLEFLKISENYNDIVNHYKKLDADIKKEAKESKQKIMKLVKLDTSIRSLSKNTVIKLDSNLDKMMVDFDIEYEYLLFALKHNFNIHSVEEEKNKEYNDNSITKMDILFNKYGFNFNDFSENMQNELIAYGVEKVEEIIKQIKYSDLTFISEYNYLFFNVIIFSNLSVIKFIDICLKSKFISKEFVLTNNKLLYDLDLFNQFFNNVNYLSNLGVNLSNKASQSVLLLDNNELMVQLNILGEYKVKLDEKNFSNFNLFKNSLLLDYFDNFIELGYGKTIVDNPRYLNETSGDMIKRIMISDLIGLSPINSNNKFIGAITTGNNFYIDPNKYDNFIIDYKEDYQNPICLNVLKNSPRNVINVSTKNMPIIKALDEAFMKDSITYVIDDVIISRKRVMRNLETLTKNVETMNISIRDLLFQAILYNMISNIESVKLEQIYNTISKMDIDKTKTYIFN